MRLLSIGIVALALSTAMVPASATEPDYTDSNLAYMMGLLRAEVERNGYDMPDLSLEVAEGNVYDSAIGREVPVTQNALDTLRDIAHVMRAVDMSALGGETEVATPTTNFGVGNNIHTYLGLRFGNCSPRSNYSVKFSAPVSVPGAFVPVGFPIVGAIVYGGNPMHATGSGWNVLGLHVYAGAPIDVNVHTSGTGVSPFLALGTDSSIDAVGVGRISTTSIAIRFFGICLFSIDAGILLENGALGVNGTLVPSQAPV